VVGDETQIGDQNLTEEQRSKMMKEKQQQMDDAAYRRAREEGTASRQLTRTRRGGLKPGIPGDRQDLDLANYDARNVNMGDLSERQGQRNPLQAFADLAGFSPKNK